MTTDVIAAIATPPGLKSAIGVVRVSGGGAQRLVSRLFTPKRKAWQSHKIYHGYIRDEGMLIDEVLCCVMRGPHSYTGEDTAEIFTHGSPAALRGVLAALIKHGARPAEPGEFTRRAFLNGRMDLAQAEAVTELINAKTEAARSAGLRMLGGGLSKRIDGYRDKILTWLAHIELSIDYPEHGEEAMNQAAIHRECLDLIRDMETLLDTAKVGRVLAEGVRTAIIGRPNVGKSSLLNAILQADRALVTEIPGTTRDIISEPVNMRGVPLLLMDTAGIRETSDTVEKLGVEKSLEQAENAALLLWVADRSQPPQPEDYALWERFRNGPMLVLLNKCDLPPAVGWSFLTNYENGSAVLEISAKDGTGLDVLYRTVEAKYLAGLTDNAMEADIITRERHRYLLESCLIHLRSAAKAAGAGMPEDIIAVDLTAAYRLLNEIVGREIGEDIVDRIFSEFCVGK